jgi:hypothetical protein
VTAVSYGCEHCTVEVSDELLPLPAAHQSRGGDPKLLRDELLHVIATQIDAHPRSAQTRIGPSEVGTPCARKLAYKLAGTPETNIRSAAWRPTVGTACHSWLEQACVAWNASHSIERFYLEQRVTVGTIGGVEIIGSCDCYDRITATVIDWKVVGPTALKKYRRQSDPGQQYRTQAHLYGRGYVAAGLPVDQVAVMFLPQSGELSDAYYWTEPYDEQVALDGLSRADGIATLVAALSRAAPIALPAVDSNCSYCPWLQRGSTDITTGCPGGDSGGLAVAAPASLADALL